MLTSWKRFLQHVLTVYHMRSYDNIQDILKSSLFSKKVALAAKLKKEILNDRSLRSA